MSAQIKVPARIQSAPPDEGEPNLKAPYNVAAEEFRPVLLMSTNKFSSQKKELRADADSYEPGMSKKVGFVSFQAKKELSVNSPVFELSSSALSFTPSFKLATNIAKISDFQFEIEKIDTKGLEKEEESVKEKAKTFPATGEFLENVKNEVEVKKNEELVRTEVIFTPEPVNLTENLMKLEKERVEDTPVEIEDLPKIHTKKVYDFEFIKKLKSDFLKDPNFLSISSDLIRIKDREVEILKKPKGNRKHEDRKITRETIAKITWRKEKTAEEKKISEKAKEYQRKFSVTLDEQKLISKQVRITLNKLSPNNLEKLCGLILETCKKSHDYLKLVVSGIFEKAWAEKKYTQMYSDICKRLKDDFEGFRYPEIDHTRLPQTKNYFKYELLYMCEETFVNNSEENELNGLNDEQKSEKLSKIKQKTLGNVRFIGELFNVNLITPRIVLECVNGLLDAFEKEKNEDKLEGACLLLETGGATFERAKLKVETDKIFERLDRIVGIVDLSARVGFRVMDVKELRSGEWKGRQKETVKAVEQLHAEFLQEQNEILRRNGLNG